MALALALQLTLLLQRMLLTESVVSRRSWTRRTHGTSIALGMRWHASSTFKCPVHDCNIFHCKLLRRPPGLACLLAFFHPGQPNQVFYGKKISVGVVGKMPAATPLAQFMERGTCLPWGWRWRRLGRHHHECVG